MDIEPGDLVVCVDDEEYSLLKSQFRYMLPMLRSTKRLYNWDIKKGEIYTIALLKEEPTTRSFFNCCGLGVDLEEIPARPIGYAIERFRKIDKKKFEHLLEVSIDTQKELEVEGA